MNGSLLFEIHGWKGIGVDRDLFCVHLILGFFTIVVCRLSVTDKMREFRERLGEIKKRLGGEE